MKSFSATLCRIAGVAVLLGAATAASAQLPKDSEVWKDRCNLMTASATAIQNGNPPAQLVAATKGISSRGFLVMAINRGQDGDHYVACTMYYMASMAEHSGNGGAKPDPLMATNYAVVAGSEERLARHLHLHMHQHVVRMKLKVEEMTGQPMTTSPEVTQAVLDAAGTAPITLDGGMPPANQQAAR
jgi:hypothetical protein